MDAVASGCGKKGNRHIKNSNKQLQRFSSRQSKSKFDRRFGFSGISYFDKKVDGLQDAAIIATQSVTGLADFVATFKDNPARRLISIYAGAFLGLLVAGFLGLDVFKAAMETAQTSTSAGGLFPYWGVAITGIVMGLGSNPTHEVIRAIQEVKKSRKAGNDPTPSFSASGDSGGFLDSASGSARTKQINTFSLRRF